MKNKPHRDAFSFGERGGIFLRQDSSADGEGGGRPGRCHERIILLGVGEAVHPRAVLPLAADQLVRQNLCPVHRAGPGFHLGETEVHERMSHGPQVVVVRGTPEHLPVLCKVAGMGRGREGTLKPSAGCNHTGVVAR